MHSDIKKALEWRYATKSFDSTKQVSETDIMTVLESMRLAPTSFGLETWRVIVVENPALRTALRAAAWDQSQFTDASHLFVFATKKVIDTMTVDAYVERIAHTRGMEVSMLEGYAGMMKGSIGARTPEAVRDWAARQAYIILGFALETAALLRIDACPMEGFDGAKFDEILGLTDLGLESRVSLALGYRLEGDATQHYTKVRMPIEELIIWK